MTQPIALGRGALPPSPPSESERGTIEKQRAESFSRHLQEHMDWGNDKALTAPTTPAKRVPVVDKSKVNPQLLKAAQGMEAMYLDYMMQTMRKTVPDNEMNLENPATKIYRGMMDSEMAQKAAKTGGVGLTDQIIAYLQPESYTGNREHPAPSQRTTDKVSLKNDPTAETRRPTGGTHEGQSVE